MTLATKPSKRPLPPPGRKASVKDAQKEILKKYAATFAKLAK